mmetsp:Transcript_28599/g.77447  ORF Transcript_28599/g.77447 Transcript_28599/m.77447 type:complete len:89 (+) Transcript_28599:159-425(+)
MSFVHNAAAVQGVSDIAPCFGSPNWMVAHEHCKLASIISSMLFLVKSVRKDHSCPVGLRWGMYPQLQFNALHCAVMHPTRTHYGRFVV